MIIILFELLSLLILFLIHNPNETPKKKTISMIFKTCCISIVISLLIAFVGVSHIELYSSYDIVEIDIHYKSSLSIEDYIDGKHVVIMDKEHNLYNIDINDCEIRWCEDIYETRVYKKVYNISPVLRVLFPSDRYTNQYIIEFNDYYGTDVPIRSQ